MDELAAAAAVMAVTTNDCAEAEEATDSTPVTVSATEVLTSISGNQGVLGSLDPRLCFPSSSRGLCSSNIIPLTFALFCPMRLTH